MASNSSARRAEVNDAIKRLMDLGTRIAPLRERLNEFPATQSLTDIMLDDTLPPEVAEIVRDIFHGKQAVTEVFKELQAVAENDIASIVKYIQEQDTTIAQLQQANKLVVDPDALAQQCQQAVIAALTAETGPLGNNFNTRIREIHRATTHDDGVLHQVHQALLDPDASANPDSFVGRVSTAVSEDDGLLGRIEKAFTSPDTAFDRLHTALSSPNGTLVRLANAAPILTRIQNALTDPNSLMGRVDTVLRDPSSLLGRLSATLTGPQALLPQIHTATVGQHSALSAVHNATVGNQSALNQVRVATVGEQSALFAVRVATTGDRGALAQIQVATTGARSNLTEVHTAIVGERSALSAVQIATTGEQSVLNEIRVATVGEQSTLSAVRTVLNETMAAVTTPNPAGVLTSRFEEVLDAVTVTNSDGITSNVCERIEAAITNTENTLSAVTRRHPDGTYLDNVNDRLDRIAISTASTLTAVTEPTIAGGRRSRFEDVLGAVTVMNSDGTIGNISDRIEAALRGLNTDQTLSAVTINNPDGTIRDALNGIATNTDHILAAVASRNTAGRYTSRFDNLALRVQARTTPVSIPLLDQPRTETPNVPSIELTGVGTSTAATPAATLAATSATNPPARQGLRSSASTSRLPVPVGTLTPATPTPVRAPSGEFTFSTPPTGATHRAQSEREKQDLRDILGATVDRSLSKQPLDFLLELDVRVGDGTSNVEGFTPLPGGLSEGTIKRLASELAKELCVLSGVKWPQVEAGVTKSTCLYFKLNSKGTSDGLFVACGICKTRNRFCIRKAKLGKKGFAVYLAPLSTTDRPSIINSQENIEMSYWVLEPEKGANGWD